MPKKQLAYQNQDIKNMHLYSTKVVSWFIITADVFVREVMWVRVMGRQAWTRLRTKIISFKPLNVILQKINSRGVEDVFINSHMHAKNKKGMIKYCILCLQFD